MIDIAALKAAAEKATPGAWDAEHTKGTIAGTISKSINARYRELASPSSVLDVIASHEALVEALTDVMEWVTSWGPDFVDDPEWPDTHAKVSAALQSITEAKP